MRIPVAGNISTRDGASNKNARMTNVLAEEKQGKTVAAVRPGLGAYATTVGNGNGITCFSGTLISVYGTTLGYGNTPASISTVVNDIYDFVKMP